MKKGFLSTALILFFVIGVLTPANVFAHKDGINEEVELTSEQKDELAFLHKNLMDQKIGIINKYVEYGVITEEKGKEMIEHLEKRYQQLEKNEFIPKCHKYKKRKDEMEKEE